MGRRKDYTGQRFGKLVAIRPTGELKRNSAVWLCKCDCGNYKTATAKSLTSGGVKSCGCIWGRYGEDLTGQRFGKLVVIRKTGERKFGCPVYLCQCDCGNTREAFSRELRDGTAWNCGCSRKPPKKRVKMQQKEIRDLTGQKFGYLTAIEPTGEMQGGYPVWSCRCDCGGHRDVSEFCLVYGRTKYCGKECPKKIEARDQRQISAPPKSGVVGVQARSNGRWSAVWRSHYIGTFATVPEAEAAIERYRRSIEGEPGQA